jgi:hypothetical protein
MAEPPQLMTAAEAMATLRCGKTRLFELLADGTIQRGARYGRHLVILAESVYAACEAEYHPPEAPKRRRGRRGAAAAADAFLAKFRAERRRSRAAQRATESGPRGG